MESADELDIFEQALEEVRAEYNFHDVDEDEDDPDYRIDEEDDDDDDDEFHDAEDGIVEVNITMEETDGEDEEDEEEDDDDEEDDNQAPRATTARPGYLTHRQLLLLLRGQDLGRVLFNDIDDDYDGWTPRRRRTRPDPERFPKIPSEEGTKLMHSGVFGSTERIVSSRLSPKKQLARRILDRELGLGDRAFRKTNQDLMAQSMIPSSQAEMIIRYDEPVYSGQFSDDGNFFFCCVKDFRVRMYDTSNPYDWRHYKTVSHPYGGWTLTDASLSPDNRWLVYSSIHPRVCLAPTDPNDTGDPYTLDLSGGGQETRPRFGWTGSRRGFAIWSVRYSGDGRELVAGTDNSTVIVYDIESRTVLHCIEGHEDDVDAVCFADKQSPHILYSGSDDATIKVWDRRSMGDRREAGAFVGHCEGLTYIDSKGDGRYILSNGKDQCVKLWDLRMAMSTERFADRNPTQHTRTSDFDYRWNDYDEDSWFKHPDDNSLVTFRGHRVQRTLIRCHFSPPGSTDSRYVYSGSYDGKVYVWNMDATLAATIDVRDATSSILPKRYRSAGYSRTSTCVREAHWHPNAPLLVASAWNGSNMDFGTCTLHSYNESLDDEAEPKMGRLVDEKLKDFEPPVEPQRHGHLVLWGEG